MDDVDQYFDAMLEPSQVAISRALREGVRHAMMTSFDVFDETAYKTGGTRPRMTLPTFALTLLSLSPTTTTSTTYTMTPARTAARTLRVSRAVPPAPRALHASARRRAVGDSPLSHNTAPKRSPWPIIIGLTAVTGGAYAYYASLESDRLSKEKRELESKTAHVGPMAEDVKLRVQEAASDARARSAAGARDVRDSAQAKLDAARDSANRTYEDAKSKVNGAVSSASSSSQSVADDAKAATSTLHLLSIISHY